MTEEDWAAPFPPESLDVVTLIFVLSAISPKQMEQVVRVYRGSVGEVASLYFKHLTLSMIDIKIWSSSDIQSSIHHFTM